MPRLLPGYDDVGKEKKQQQQASLSLRYIRDKSEVNRLVEKEI